MTPTSFKLNFFLVFALYLSIVLIYMMFLPYGDEPDFIRVAPKYIDFLGSLHLNYFDGLITIIENNDKKTYGYETYALSNCQYVVNPKQFFGVYDYISCKQNPILGFKRTTLTVLIYFPLMFLVFQKNKTQRLNDSFIHTNYILNNKSFQLCFLFPAFIYYSSVFSLEQITLMLSVSFIFTFFNSKYIYSIPIFMLLFFLDRGNALVVLTITSYTFFALIVYKKVGFLYYMVLNLLAIIFVYLLSTQILYFLGPYSSVIAEKLNDLSNWNDISTKYPLWSRPFMTLLSYSFMPPAYSKHLLVYSAMFLGGGFTIYRHFCSGIRNQASLSYLVAFIAVISSISIIVFILPGHSNAKYYIFTLPIVINTFLNYFSYKALFKFFLLINLIILINYILFYIIGCHQNSCSTFL